MRVKCPFCSTLLDHPGIVPGARVQCWECEKKFSVAEPAPKPSPETIKSAAPAAAARTTVAGKSPTGTARPASATTGRVRIPVSKISPDLRAPVKEKSFWGPVIVVITVLAIAGVGAALWKLNKLSATGATAGSAATGDSTADTRSEEPEIRPAKLAGPIKNDHIGRSMNITLADSPFCAGCTGNYRDWFGRRADETFAAGNPEQLRGELKQKLVAVNEEGLKKQLEDGDMTLALAQHELLRSATSDRLKTILKAPGGPAFLKQFMGDRDWLESYLCAGLLPVSDDGKEKDLAGKGLEVIFGIWTKDPDCARHQVLRRLSVAVALSFTQPGQWRVRDKSTPVDRYKFYRDSWAAGRLHSSFDKLNAWDMRYVAGALCDDASLAWLQENIRMPVSKMSDACWAIEYRGTSHFCDSIQGPDFYTPWDDDMFWAKNAFFHGGVCGSLSYFGTASISARGIPAIPCGQPGHCAYSFRPAKGEWIGGFGGPAGGCHTAIYSHNSSYRDMTEDALADSAATLASRRHAWQAMIAEENGGRSIENAAWNLAISAAPMPYEAWLSATRWRLQQGDAIGDWNGWIDRMAAAFRKHPYVMFELVELCENKIAPDVAAKLALWSRLHAMTADEWRYPTWNDLPNILNAQAGRIGGGDEGRMQVAEMILPATAKSEKTFPAAVHWAQDAFPKSNAGRNRWLATLGKALGRGVSGSKKDKLNLYNKAILAAAAAGARESFQSLAEQARRTCDVKPPNVPKVEPFPGENLAAGGILRTSSTSGWDCPAIHPCILKEGGSFHTDKQKRPFVEVRLPKLAELSGIVVVNRGNNYRIPPLKIIVSEDGTKWTEVARFTNEQDVYRADLSTHKLRTRYIRIERDDDREEYFHLNLIHAYGRRLE